MALKLSVQDFVQRARSRHGDTYDYSRVQYKSMAERVVIVCRVHGPFTQIATNHLAGRGCARCAEANGKGGSQRTREQFIAAARKVHGEWYSYDEVHYKNAVTKVNITCPKHGTFSQQANSHLRGAGCGKCADALASKRMRFDNSHFLEKARARHGDEFDYSRVKYERALKPVEIVCRTHGVFRQAPAMHWAGQRCPKCAYERQGLAQRSTNDEFISQARAVHGDKYDYNETRYVKRTERIHIRCNLHGIFEQSPDSHLSGKGCRECAKLTISQKQRRTLESFVHAARAMHGDQYDYSNVEYTSARAQVVIVCRKHGRFRQVADVHLSGSGCRRCASEELPGAYSLKRFREDVALAQSEGHIYYVRLSNQEETFYKVGITRNSVSQRFAGTGYTLKVLGVRSLPLLQAFELEQLLIADFVSKHRYRPYRWSAAGQRHGGHSECFSRPLSNEHCALFDGEVIRRRD